MVGSPYAVKNNVKAIIHLNAPGLAVGGGS